MDNDLQAIERQRAQWINAINQGSVEDFVAVLVEDAVWLPGGQPAIAGKETIRQWLAQPFAAYDYRYSVGDIRVRLAGDWAVEGARFTTRVRSNGEEAPEHRGAYTLLWRRETGTWLIERYIDHTGG